MKLQHNKIRNLQLAAACVNNIIVKPGEVFSFWFLINKPTKAKGYLPGMVLSNGQVVAGMGGGLCQLSNLIYWITLHTPLTVIERWRHDFDVFPDVDRTQPFGSGATVVYNYIDLQIRNDTESLFQLHISLDKQYLYGEWLTEHKPVFNYRIYEKEHHVSPQWWGGYIRHNKIYRKKYNLIGEEIEDEFMAENNAIMMYAPLLPY